MLNVKNENVRNVTEIFPKTYLGVFVKPDVIAIKIESIAIGTILAKL